MRSVVTTPVRRSFRVQQIESIFDLPAQTTQTRQWESEIDLNRDWSVGLIVGPSGAGKSTVAREIFQEQYFPPQVWDDAAIVDCAPDRSLQDVLDCFSAVGLNSIPTWVRPFSTLSNGEQFRADLARRLLTLSDPIVVDEFTSVVDRQVAKIAAHAVQKFVRRHRRQFVAVTCHWDVLDWLQPDWVLDPSTMVLQWRCLQRRPRIDYVIREADRGVWPLFASHHYLSDSLHRAAKCYLVTQNETFVAFAGVLHMPHPRRRNLKRVSRLVVLPDWQGCGIAIPFLDALGQHYRMQGQALRIRTSHPMFARALSRAKAWRCDSSLRRPSRQSRTSSIAKFALRAGSSFEYVGGGAP